MGVLTPLQNEIVKAGLPLLPHLKTYNTPFKYRRTRLIWSNLNLNQCTEKENN